MQRELVQALLDQKRYHNSEGLHSSVDLLINYYGGIKDFYEHNYNTTWELPQYYEVLSARLISESGEEIVNYDNDALCLWSYSPPVEKWVTYDELAEHIFTNELRPNDTLFHFRNQYRSHSRDWGFSLPFKIYSELDRDISYYVDIKTKFSFSPMQQYLSKLPSDQNNFILVAHLDHPNQLNDGLTACLVNNEVSKEMEGKLTNVNLVSLNSVEITGTIFFNKKYNINSSNTIGALSTNGLVLDANYRFQSPFNDEDQNLTKLIKIFAIIYGDGDVDRFREGWGNDEIAFEVPSVNVPCASIHRFPHSTYHSQNDNMDGWSTERFEESKDIISSFIKSLDCNYVYRVCNIDHLLCFSSPEINLYLDPINISGLPGKGDTLRISLTVGLNAKERSYIIDNAELLNRFMNWILPMFSKTSELTVIDIANESRLPPIFIYNYLEKMVDQGFLERVRYYTCRADQG